MCITTYIYTYICTHTCKLITRGPEPSPNATGLRRFPVVIAGNINDHDDRMNRMSIVLIIVLTAADDT